MSVVSERGDPSSLARLGKEFSRLAKSMELYETRDELLRGIQDMHAMQLESSKYCIGA